jgi:CheY-like chemotaxis protein
LIGSDRRLEVIPTGEPVRVVIDRNQLEQVLINLVANARDATTTDGLITVSTDALEIDAEALRAYRESETQAGWFTRVAVRDNGCGMSPDVLTRVFEPFFTTKPVGHGTGLGLSMVDGIVRQCGGFTRIDSAPGAGTLVTIYVPRVDIEVTQRPAATAAPSGRGEAVLVVEDEPVVRSLARRVLEMHGYTVYQAPNGAAALQFLAAHPGAIELVLTDIVMPRMNGYELAENIRELEPTLPVLFMSGYSGDEIRQRGLSMTSIPFLSKPITPRALAVAVRERLDQARHGEKAKVR